MIKTAKMLQEGSKAPAFKGLDQNGKTIALSSFKGQKLVLYFYPHDMTPTCTVQACNLRDNHKILAKKGYQVVGVSSDDQKSHLKFIAKHDLPFPLIADTDLVIHEKYGVWDEKKFMGKTYMGTLRTTFIIDENGVIEKIITKPDSKNHGQEILGAPKKK